MRATVMYGPGQVGVEDAPEPELLAPTDALVRIVASCVCGSDLWPYRGLDPLSFPHFMGHEFVGVVDQVGDEVSSVKTGDFVIAPFAISDGTCAHCRNGITTSCSRGAWWGSQDAEGLPTSGAQAEWARVPLADGTLVVVPGSPGPFLVPSLLTLSDVMCTGHHAAVSARVGPGSTVAVVGDGAVGLCAVLAAKRLGAERVVSMSRHAGRQELAHQFGATDIVAERGEKGAAVVKRLLDGTGADAVLECVGTKESMQQALDCTRPGGFVGYVGVPAGGPEFPIEQMFRHNLNVAGGVAPARTYIPELLGEVLDGRIDPGRVFDLELSLDEAAEAYAAMDERRAVKALLRP